MGRIDMVTAQRDLGDGRPLSMAAQPTFRPGAAASVLTDTDDDGSSFGTDDESFMQPQKEPLENWRLVLLTMAMGGGTLGYGLQVGGGTAVMRNLGLSNGVTQAVWLFGPISGAQLTGDYEVSCSTLSTTFMPPTLS